MRITKWILPLLLLAGCDEQDFLDGYDRDALFAAPSRTEIGNVMDDWNSRVLVPSHIDVRTQPIAGANTKLKIISYTVGGLKQYGAIVVPDNGDHLPVRMYIGGFGIDVTMNSIKLIQDASTATGFIFAIPALRGQSINLIINDNEYVTPVAEGEHCDAFDGATDDAIAFLNAIENAESRADVNRVSVRGGSRGATVALLMGERDKRVKICIAVAGPVDLLQLTSKSENDATYQCQFLNELHEGQSVAVVRRKMLASSPIYFASHLPVTQVHLAADDRIVPVSQGEQLQKVIDTLAVPPPFELYRYEHRTHTNLADDNQEMADRIEQLLSHL
jgi:hypothetical protein